MRGDGLRRNQSSCQVPEHRGQVLRQRLDGVDGQYLAGPRRELRQPPFDVGPVAALVPAGDAALAAFQPGPVQFPV